MGITEDKERLVKNIKLLASDIDDQKLFNTRQFPYPYYRAMMYFILRTKGYTLVQIGEAFNRNHTTIFHALQSLDVLSIDKKLSNLKFVFEELIKIEDDFIQEIHATSEKPVRSLFEKVKNFIGFNKCSK